MLWNATDESQDGTCSRECSVPTHPTRPPIRGYGASDNNDWCFDARYAYLPTMMSRRTVLFVHVGGSYSFRHIGGLTPTARTTKTLPTAPSMAWPNSARGHGSGAKAPSVLARRPTPISGTKSTPELLVIWDRPVFKLNTSNCS